MSDEDLELLITLDDPEGAPEEDIFQHEHQEDLDHEMLFAFICYY